GAAGVRRRRRGAVRLLHAGSRGRDRGPPAPEPGPVGRRDPRGAVGEPLPLHRLRQDLRRGARSGGCRREPPRMTQTVRELQVGRVGEIVRRTDAPPKVKGEFAYASDLVVPGMLWGHTLRSPWAHARIASIDVSEAVAMPGVHAVLTHDDVPGQKTYGLE